MSRHTKNKFRFIRAVLISASHRSGLRQVTRRFTLTILLGFILCATAPATPVLVRQPQDHSVVAGGTASLNVTVTGDEPVRYEWWDDFGPLYPAPLVSGY